MKNRKHKGSDRIVDFTVIKSEEEVEAIIQEQSSYSTIGQQQKAIQDYDEVIRLKPDYAYAYFNRANAYFMQGNNELGCSDAQKACSLGDCKALGWAKDKGYCGYSSPAPAPAK